MKRSILVAADGSYVGTLRAAEPPLSELPDVLTWCGRVFRNMLPGSPEPTFIEVSFVALGYGDVDQGPVK